MAKRIDITNIARRIIAGEDFEQKLSKNDFGRLLQLMARWTRSAHRQSKSARDALAEQPRWHAEYHTVLESHRRLERTHENLKRNYEALEEQQQRHSVQFDQMVSHYSKQVSELSAKLVAAEKVLALLAERSHIMSDALEIQEVFYRNNAALQKLGFTLKNRAEEDEAEKET